MARTAAQIAATERMLAARREGIEARRTGAASARPSFSPSPNPLLGGEAELPQLDPSEGGAGDLPRAVGRNARPTPGRAAPSVAVSKVSDDELTALFVGACNGIAELPGQSHWHITAEEAKAVTVPLTRWMAGKSKAAKFAAENANTLLLIGGLAGVLGPRVALTARKGFRDDGHGRSDRGAAQPDSRNPLTERNAGGPVDLASRRGARPAHQARAERGDGGDAEAVNAAVASSLANAARAPIF